MISPHPASRGFLWEAFGRRPSVRVDNLRRAGIRNPSPYRSFATVIVKGSFGSHPEKTGGPWSDRFTSASRHSLSAHQPSGMGQYRPAAERLHDIPGNLPCIRPVPGTARPGDRLAFRTPSSAPNPARIAAARRSRVSRNAGRKWRSPVQLRCRAAPMPYSAFACLAGWGLS